MQVVTKKEGEQIKWFEISLPKLVIPAPKLVKQVITVLPWESFIVYYQDGSARYINQITGETEKGEFETWRIWPAPTRTWKLGKIEIWYKDYLFPVKHVATPCPVKGHQHILNGELHKEKETIYWHPDTSILCLYHVRKLSKK